MKVLSPVNNVSEIEKVVSAGADEVYCGVLTPAWQGRFAHTGTINGSPSRFHNLADLDELRHVVEVAHTHDAKVFATYNSYYYSRDQYHLLEKEVEGAVSAGVDGIIAADIGLMRTLVAMDTGVELHVSVVGGAFNSRTVAFYRELGASRVVLPKQLTLEEIGSIAADRGDMVLECFILTVGCNNAEALCRFQHGVIEARHPWLSRFVLNNPLQSGIIRAYQRKGAGRVRRFLQEHTFLADRAACCLRYELEPMRVMEEGELARVRSCLAPLLSNAYEHERMYGCGVCALPELARMGISTVKTEDRAAPLGDRLNNIAFVKAMLKELKSTTDDDAFCIRARERFGALRGFACGDDYCNNLVG